MFSPRPDARSRCGGSLYFVYLPDLSSVLGQRDRNMRYEVIAIARALELPVIDLTDDFQQYRSALAVPV